MDMNDRNDEHGETGGGGSGGEADERHIIDVLLEERAPRLVRHPLWPLLRPPLYLLLGYRKARRLADDIAPLGGDDAMAHSSELLELCVDTECEDRVPADGACLLVANHPAGIADGIALYDALRLRRPDVCFFANADAHRICPGFDEILIPVMWPPEERTRASIKETLKRAGEAIEANRPIVVFPAGAMAEKVHGRLREQDWEASPIKLARRYALPVVPCYVQGPPSRLRRFFARISRELRDMTVFQEFYGKRHGTYRLRFGPPIPADAWTDERGNDTARAQRLKSYVEDELAHSPDATFPAGGDSD